MDFWHLIGAGNLNTKIEICKLCIPLLGYDGCKFQVVKFLKVVTNDLAWVQVLHTSIFALIRTKKKNYIPLVMRIYICLVRGKRGRGDI